MKQSRVDSGYPIVPRTGIDFGLDGDIPKYWFGGDVFRTRFFDALSTVFPEGEKFFIHCVRHYRDQIADPALAAQVVGAVNRLREMELEKLPGVAETIDWTQSLEAIGAQSLTAEAALDTLGAVVKDRDDLEYASRSIQDVVA